MDLRSFIREVPDFPKKGINFKDISPLLASPVAFDYAVKQIAEKLQDLHVNTVVAIESRGFIFGAPVARDLRLPLVLVRKPGKLPATRVSVEYELEYGCGTLEAHSDAIQAGSRVAIIDDVLATGGTAAAAGDLVRKLHGSVGAYCFLLELGFLDGRKRLQDAAQLISLEKY